MNASGKRPAFQWYPGDWRRDVALQSCGLEARGLWVEMLNLMHDGEPYGHLTAGGMAITAPMLGTLVGIPAARAKRLLAELEARKIFSRTDADVIFSRRMVRDELLRLSRAEFGKLGGNPSLTTKQARARNKVNPPVNASLKPELTPAVAVAVASAELPPRSSARSAVGDALADPPAPPWQPILEEPLACRLATDADRIALTTLLKLVERKAAWVAELSVMLDGGMSGHPSATPAQLGEALRDYVANGRGTDAPNLRHFRAYVERIVRTAESRAVAPIRSAAGRVSHEGGAALVFGKIRSLVRESQQPGQALKRYIPRADVEKLGADVLQAYDAIGGADRIITANGEQLGFVLRDFVAAMGAAHAA